MDLSEEQIDQIVREERNGGLQAREMFNQWKADCELNNTDKNNAYEQAKHAALALVSRACDENGEPLAVLDSGVYFVIVLPQLRYYKISRRASPSTCA